MPSASFAAVGQMFGRYELLAPLAMGGTAEIFLAKIVGEAGFEKLVVVKRLLEHLQDDREFVDMFLDEARLGARLDHSNIVQTLDLGEVDGRYYIAMEFLAGLSLAQIAGKAQQRVAGGLPVELSLGMIAQAASGLHYAHECRLTDGSPLKIVHRDVSPQNLVVTFEGEVKIVDFGIAHAAQREAHTKSGFIKGKFAYMAPEQCLGRPLDRRTDVFALGTIAWELVTGRRLFKRDTTYATYQAIVKGEVHPPTSVNPRLDPGIDDVIMKALMYDADNRYQTAEDFAEAIHAFLHRRGKRAQAGEVARFVEKHFAEEIDEHGARMGTLMSGVTSGMMMQAWDAEEQALEVIDEVRESSAAGVTSPGADDLEGETLIDPEPAKKVAKAIAAARASNEMQVARATSPPTAAARPSMQPPSHSRPYPAQPQRHSQPHALPLAPPRPSGPVAAQQPYASSPPAQPFSPAGQPVQPPGQPVQPPSFATGSYGPSSDADRLAMEKGTGGGARMWLYPVVFVLAAGFGVGALLLIDSLR